MRRLIPLLALVVCAYCGKPAPITATSPVGTNSATATTSNVTVPASFVRSTADGRITRLIDVRDGLTHAQAMRILTDALGQNYTVDVTDPRTGFAMTTWQASLMREGVPDLRYRTRVTARFLGDDWKRLQIRHEANWARGDEWDVGYDAAQLDSVTTDLRSRIGKKP